MAANPSPIHGVRDVSVRVGWDEIGFDLNNLRLFAGGTWLWGE